MTWNIIMNPAANKVAWYLLDGVHPSSSRTSLSCPRRASLAWAELVLIASTVAEPDTEVCLSCRAMFSVEAMRSQTWKTQVILANCARENTGGHKMGMPCARGWLTKREDAGTEVASSCRGSVLVQTPCLALSSSLHSQLSSSTTPLQVNYPTCCISLIFPKTCSTADRRDEEESGSLWPPSTWQEITKYRLTGPAYGGVGQWKDVYAVVDIVRHPSDLSVVPVSELK